MAYTHWNELTPVSISERLEDCTPTEDGQPVSFYVEDVLRVINQPDCVSISKKMAIFWGLRLQVWAGYKSNGEVLKNVIALQCPPYYPPHTFPGVEETESNKPPNFPTSFP